MSFSTSVSSFGNRDLGLGGELEPAFAHDLAIELADHRINGFSHHALAVDLLEVRDRHLSRTEAAQLDALLELAEPQRKPRLEIGCRHLNLKFALEAVGEDFSHFHSEHLHLRPQQRRSVRSQAPLSHKTLAKNE